MLNQPELYIAIDFTPFVNNTVYLDSFLKKWHEVFENNYSNPEWYGTLGKVIFIKKEDNGGIIYKSFNRFENGVVMSDSYDGDDEIPEEYFLPVYNNILPKSNIALSVYIGDSGVFPYQRKFLAEFNEFQDVLSGVTVMLYDNDRDKMINSFSLEDFQDYFHEFQFNELDERAQSVAIKEVIEYNEINSENNEVEDLVYFENGVIMG